MAKVIYIAGLGHSGSTLLDMSLGTLDNVVGFGELKTLLNQEDRERHFKSTCSCGKKAGQCEWWKEFPEVIKDAPNENEMLDRILAAAALKFGPQTTIVDSSKNSNSYLSYLNDKHDLRLIYLTRDIRSWSYSRRLSTGKPIIYFILRWIMENAKLRNRIKRMGISPLFVGYEELALHPEFVLRKICDHCALEYSPDLLRPDRTHSHIISGNIARIDPEKRSGWQYDSRWLTSARVMALSVFLIPLIKWNTKYVYGNLRKKSMQDFHLFGVQRKKDLSERHN